MTRQWKTGRPVTAWDVRNMFLSGLNTYEIAIITGLAEHQIDRLHWQHKGARHA
jgi:hypothetical protein